MKQENIQILESFDLSNMPNLDVAVLGALELFQKEKLPQIDLSAYKKPLVVGSGNAEATARIIFENFDAIFASESNYEQKLRNIKSIDGVVCISASGEKHAPIILETAKKYIKSLTLITNNTNSSAGKEADNQYVFPKNREPYTYNTSTYMGMILGSGGEDPAKIYKFINEEIKKIELPDFSKYDKFFLIVPPQFSLITRMLQVKFIELFGRNIARDIETSEYMKHAATVVPSDELFINFSDVGGAWGRKENSLNIPLPKNSSYAAMMAIGYYIIGQIQASHPAYFKDNILEYTKNASKVFGTKINPIVE